MTILRWLLIKHISCSFELQDNVRPNFSPEYKGVSHTRNFCFFNPEFHFTMLNMNDNQFLRLRHVHICEHDFIRFITIDPDHPGCKLCH